MSSAPARIRFKWCSILRHYDNTLALPACKVAKGARGENDNGADLCRLIFCAGKNNTKKLLSDMQFDGAGLS